MTNSKNEPGIPGKKPVKLSGPEQVAQFLSGLEHPFKREIEEVRNIILGVNDQITEHIKWKAPSFCFNGEDRITFNLHGKGFFRLVFHTGAKVQEHAVKGNLFDDPTGLLEWVAADRAIVTITDMEDVEGKQEKLAEVVAQWIKGTADGHTGGPC